MKDMTTLPKGSTFSWADYKDQMTYNRFKYLICKLKENGSIKPVKGKRAKNKTKSAGRPPSIYKVISVENNFKPDKEIIKKQSDLDKIKTEIDEIKHLLVRKRT